MLRKLEIRDRAMSDIEKIALYIAKQNRDSLVADRFARRLLDRCADLVAAPRMGSACTTPPGTHKINEGAYKIFYRVTDTKVIVLRVWDGRRQKGPRVL